MTQLSHVSATPISDGIVRPKLPELDDAGIPGSRIVRRAVSLTLATFAVLLVALVVSLNFVVLHVTVDGAGALEPVRIWPIRAASSGIVRELLVTSGDSVAPGQIIARMDGFVDSTTVAQLQAQLMAGRVARERDAAAVPYDRRMAQENIERAGARVLRARAALREQLTTHGLKADVDALVKSYVRGTHVALDLSIADVMSAQTDELSARTQLERLQLSVWDSRKSAADLRHLEVQLRAAEQRQSRLSISSPVGGTVLTELLERVPGSLVQEGEALLELAEMEEWRATITVAERDVYRVRRGDRVNLEVPALSSLNRDRMFGTVETVAAEPAPLQEAQGGPQGSGTASATGYRVVVRIDRDHVDSGLLSAIRRGYSVRAHIVTRADRAIILIRDYFRERSRTTK